MATIASDSATGAGTVGAHRPIFAGYVLPILAGLVLVVAQVVLSFFPRPVFLGSEAVAFALVSAVVACRFARQWWMAALLVAGPAFLCMALILGVALGPAKLAEGVGSSWLISLGLVPISAIVGAYVGGRMGSRPVN